MRDSFVFYRSFYEAIKDLPPNEQVNAFHAIADYAFSGIEPSGNGIDKTVFLLTKPQIDANNRRYENGINGGRPKTKSEPNNNLDKTKSEPNVNVNVNDNDKKESKKKKATHFVPPTLEELKAYCIENGLHNVDGERFIDFYESKGWMVGKTKMKSWKASARNWNRSQRQELTAKTKRSSTEREFDANAMECSMYDNF